jgi:hypothetical protein
MTQLQFAGSLVGETQEVRHEWLDPPRRMTYTDVLLYRYTKVAQHRAHYRSKDQQTRDCQYGNKCDDQRVLDQRLAATRPVRASLTSFIVHAVLHTGNRKGCAYGVAARDS